MMQSRYVRGGQKKASGKSNSNSNASKTSSTQHSQHGHHSKEATHQKPPAKRGQSRWKGRNTAASHTGGGGGTGLMNGTRSGPPLPETRGGTSRSHPQNGHFLPPLAPQRQAQLATILPPMMLLQPQQPQQQALPVDRSSLPLPPTFAPSPPQLLQLDNRYSFSQVSALSNHSSSQDNHYLNGSSSSAGSVHSHFGSNLLGQPSFLSQASASGSNNHHSASQASLPQEQQQQAQSSQPSSTGGRTDLSWGSSTGNPLGSFARRANGPAFLHSLYPASSQPNSSVEDSRSSRSTLSGQSTQSALQSRASCSTRSDNSNNSAGDSTTLHQHFSGSSRSASGYSTRSKEPSSSSQLPSTTSMFLTHSTVRKWVHQEVESSNFQAKCTREMQAAGDTVQQEFKADLVQTKQVLESEMEEKLATALRETLERGQEELREAIGRGQEVLRETSGQEQKVLKQQGRDHGKSLSDEGKKQKRAIVSVASQETKRFAQECHQAKETTLAMILAKGKEVADSFPATLQKLLSSWTKFPTSSGSITSRVSKKSSKKSSTEAVTPPEKQQVKKMVSKSSFQTVRARKTFKKSPASLPKPTMDESALTPASTRKRKVETGSTRSSKKTKISPFALRPLDTIELSPRTHATCSSQNSVVTPVRKTPKCRKHKPHALDAGSHHKSGGGKSRRATRRPSHKRKEIQKSFDDMPSFLSQE